MKRVVRILLITLGICIGLFLLIGLPLLTHIWVFTIIIGTIITAVFLVWMILGLIDWAWSKD
jgi:hypothetical protein